MNTESKPASVIMPEELLKHWQGHRRLTRKLIEAFPEKEFFEYSIGGMRPFAAMVKELLAIAVPGLVEIVGGEAKALNENASAANTKEDLLAQWDEATERLNHYFRQIPTERFGEQIVLFGQYPGTVVSSILYFIDNEIHHRGQAYVYMRSLGVEPHPFWDR